MTASGRLLLFMALQITSVEGLLCGQKQKCLLGEAASWYHMG